MIKKSTDGTPNGKTAMYVDVCTTYERCDRYESEPTPPSNVIRTTSLAGCLETSTWVECTTYYINDSGGGGGTTGTDPGTGGDPSGGGGGTGGNDGGWADDPCSGGSTPSVQRTMNVVPCDDPIGWEPIDDGIMIEEYSGFAVDEPDDNGEYIGPRERIPAKIILENGKTVTIVFYKTQDGVSSDQPVAPRVMEALKYALNKASETVEISSIGISATTNGQHAVNSNHGKGLALDISRINGTRIFDLGSSNVLVKQLQLSLDQYTNIRENFGPYFKHKFTNPWSVGGHQDHIHYSVNSY